MADRENRQSGQSTTEFTLMMMLILGFTFFFLQLAQVFAFGNYAHYATFMAARAYMAAGPDQDDQEQRAKRVIVRMLKKSQGEAGVDRFPTIAKGTGDSDLNIPGFKVKTPPEFSPTERRLSWQEGVRYTFRSRLFVVPALKAVSSRSASNVNSLTLTSESWLGREPTTTECTAEMSAIGGEWDNGC